MVLQLTKRVPARTLTATAAWCRKDFMEMSPRFRDIRGEKDRMCTCYWCKHKHQDGEMMAIACFNKVGNKTLCQSCADKLLTSDGEEGTSAHKERTETSQD